MVVRPLNKAVHFWCAAFFITCSLILFSACTSRKKEVAPDLYYFKGIDLLDQGHTDLAVALFSAGKTKKGEPLLAPLCQIELLKIAQGKQLEKEKKYARKYFADNADVMALVEKDTLWQAPVPGQLFYRQNEQLKTAGEYYQKGDYTRAVSCLEYAFPDAETEDMAAVFLELSLEEVSAVCRMYLYGAGEKHPRALLLSSVADYARDTGGDAGHVFLLQFYTGRLYAYAGRSYYDTACSWFEKAMATAPDEARYDNALWYLLDTRRKQSPSSGAAAIKLFCGTWHDPAYFDDLYEDICADFCNQGMWGSVYQLLLNTADSMSADIRVMYLYISGRAIETGLITSVPAAQRQSVAGELLQSAWELHAGSLYYRMLLSEKLGKTLFTGVPDAVAAQESSQTRRIQDLLLNGYCFEQMWQYVMPVCTEYSGTFEMSTLLDCVERISNAAQRNSSMSSFALRAASYASDWSDYAAGYDERLLPYVFPQYYKEQVLSAAEECNLDPSLLFAVIRSESYFDAAVQSHAGAVGLSQLMPATAGDVARKLKVDTYDLTDAETNARFGAFYLEELIGRLDGDVLLAAMSYNAGINNVRKWRRAMPGLPHDLFLEAVPFEETRGYGRKITTAYSMYAMLYADASPHEIVRYLRLSQ